MLRKILWLQIGDRKLHLLKVAGAFFLFSAMLKLAESLYWIFVTVEKARAASIRPELVTQLFGWTIESNAVVHSFTSEDWVGVLLGPIAAFLFWFGLTIVALMIYQSGKVVLPIEEYEQKISDHHKSLIAKAVAHVKKRK